MYATLVLIIARTCRSEMSNCNSVSISTALSSAGDCVLSSSSFCCWLLISVGDGCAGCFWLSLSVELHDLLLFDTMVLLFGRLDCVDAWLLGGGDLRFKCLFV